MSLSFHTLDECAVLVRDSVHPRDAKGMPYIGLEHIEEGSLHLKAHGWAEDVTSAKSRFKKGDILFGKLRPYFRKAIIAPFDGVCSTDIWVVRAKPGMIQDYIFYWMASEDFVNFANSGSIGTRMPRAKWEHASRHKQRKLSPKEQRAIARTLGALDDKIETNRKMNATLESIAQALFQSWFIDFTPVHAKSKGRTPGLPPQIAALFPSEFEDSSLGPIPRGWRISRIGEEVTTILGGTPSRIKPEYWGGTIPWINSGKTNDFRVTSPSEFITQEGLDSSSTKILPPRTTILAITGATLGQISLTEFETCANQSIAGILGNSKLPSEFIYFWSKARIDDLLAWQTGAAQQHINKTNVNNLPVLCPGEAVIISYLDQVRPLFDCIKTRCYESLSLATIRDALLLKLLSGELRAKAAG